MDGASLTGGFANAQVDAAYAFRAVLDAMARPGTITQIVGATPPAPLSIAAGSVLLTLCDGETPLHLAGAADCKAVRDWITFHCGAPLVGRDRAMFVVGTWEALIPLTDYAIGTPEYPDRSATLIVETETLAPEGPRLTGPGIESEAALNLPAVEPLQMNAALYPLGLDVIFCAGDQVAALPRTTKVEAR
ncbi:MAG: phosphonate C-P lyase system protein PhnH [Pseudomonadota bacterium]